MDRIEHWFFTAWPILSPLLCFLLGVICTRWVLVPRFCPECVRRREWTAAMQKESRDKKESDGGKPKSGNSGKTL